MTFNAHMVELEFAARTDKGLVRERNEDAIGVNQHYGIAILADGMGGYNAGDVASSLAMTTIMDVLTAELPAAMQARRVRGRCAQKVMSDAVREANRVIYGASRDDMQFSGMGTTVVAALFHHDRIVVAHVGDSRLYCWRKGEMVSLTRDHSLVQEHIDAGLVNIEEARLSPSRNLITRALGVEECVDVEVHEYTTMAGDIYLLCSDGLSDMLSNEEIAGILQHGADDIDAASSTLIWQANANGGHDNISVILVSVKAVHPEKPLGLLDRFLNWAS